LKWCAWNTRALRPSNWPEKERASANFFSDTPVVISLEKLDAQYER